jgi:hypothetical protein
VELKDWKDYRIRFLLTILTMKFENKFWNHAESLRWRSSGNGGIESEPGIRIKLQVIISSLFLIVEPKIR